jgi:hypothetical protein
MFVEDFLDDLWSDSRLSNEEKYEKVSGLINRLHGMKHGFFNKSTAFDLLSSHEAVLLWGMKDSYRNKARMDRMRSKKEATASNEPTIKDLKDRIEVLENLLSAKE